MFIVGGFRQVLKIRVGGRCSESTSQCALVLGESDVRKNGLCSQHVFLLRCLLMGSSSVAISALWHRRGLELFPTSLLCSRLSSRWWDLQTAASSNGLFLMLAQIRWTKTAGSASDRFQDSSVFNETLRIANIQRHQGGRYYCKAENGLGSPAIKSIRVDVYCK